MNEILSADAIEEGKGYVELNSVDGSTSHSIADGVEMMGGRHLVTQVTFGRGDASGIYACFCAQIVGAQTEAESGSLIVLAAGDQSLYNECTSVFNAIAWTQFYLGDIDMADKMYFIMNMISGIQVSLLAEVLELGKLCSARIESASFC